MVAEMGRKVHAGFTLFRAAGKREDLGSGGEQLGDQVAAEQPCGAGDQDPAWCLAAGADR
jgi:hypothetical protein